MALDFPNSPVDGQFYEGFVWSDSSQTWRVTKDPASSFIVVKYGIVGGGGSGTIYAGGGGGGFRSSYPSTNSGGGLTYPENPLVLGAGTYTVTVGAGGSAGTQGGTSQFATLTSIGGGSPQGYGGTSQSGGSGGGATGNASRAGGAGTAGQGFAGGSTSPDGYGGYNQGAGGGASSAASNTTKGAGITTSEFTGSSVLYSEGGTPTGSAKSVANDGHGNNGGAARNGNAGLVSITLATGRLTSVSGGLTYTSTVVGSETRYVFTAGTGTVTLA